MLPPAASTHPRPHDHFPEENFLEPIDRVRVHSDASPDNRHATPAEGFGPAGAPAGINVRRRAGRAFQGGRI